VINERERREKREQRGRERERERGRTRRRTGPPRRGRSSLHVEEEKPLIKVARLTMNEPARM